MKTGEDDTELSHIEYQSCHVDDHVYGLVIS